MFRNVQSDDQMGLTAEDLAAGIRAVAAIEPAIAARLEACGLPQPRVNPRGHKTLLRTIIGQQVSVQAAAAVWRRLEEAIGAGLDPAALVAASDETLRAAGLSRQKSGYVRSLAGLVASGELDLDRLPVDDEPAIADLIKVKGIGRWSAEIYLLFAEGRPDIWPAGDLAIQLETGRILGHEGKPPEKWVREVAEAWRPHRGAAAIFTWHSYAHRNRKADAAVIPV